MEDAHIHYSDIDGDQDTALFGVFDGHGGKEVAVYVSRHFKEELLKTQEYKDKSFGKALALTF